MSVTPTATHPSYRSCNGGPPNLPMDPTSQTNLAYCGYIMGQRRLFVHRPLATPVTMAFCQITCECGTLRIDEGDGLPVELIEFDVESGD